MGGVERVAQRWARGHCMTIINLLTIVKSQSGSEAKPMGGQTSLFPSPFVHSAAFVLDKLMCCSVDPALIERSDRYRTTALLSIFHKTAQGSALGGLIYFFG